ncbi:hypothetical protein Bpfe_012674 [Biomphalaria pfeifferi]|uniref:Uncharacterized protein n=1 Tax=Biomphalaria pfeifferi TaxID=112525 RepID=A0AAD8BP86_BIOPF|nr:hypothetical protein Bpfe_012674 [Biomphalaria pfeifferi]
MWSSKQDFLWLDELLTCHFVHFNKTRVQVETLVSADTSTKYMVRIDLEDAEFNFTEKDKLKKLTLEEDGAVNVCVDLLDSKLKELQEKLQAAEASESFLSLYVITVICLGVSPDDCSYLHQLQDTPKCGWYTHYDSICHTSFSSGFAADNLSPSISEYHLFSSWRQYSLHVALYVCLEFYLLLSHVYNLYCQS